jgi:hypothetical protein
MKRKNIGSTLDSLFDELGERKEVEQMTKAKLAKMGEKAITRGGPDRRMKLCRCHGCGIEAVCMPRFDFYTRGKSKKGPLYCYPCLCDASGVSSPKRERN